MSGDNAATQERAELFDSTPLPRSTPIWLSDQFRIVSYQYTGAQQYTHLEQIHFTAGGNVPNTWGPEYSLVASPNPDGKTASVRVITRGITNSGVVRWQANVPFGTWHHLVACVTVGRTTDGYLKLWIDGQQVFDAAIPLGYDTPVGPVWKFGNYSNKDTVARIVEHANVERSFSSLEHRVSAPLPI